MAVVVTNKDSKRLDHLKKIYSEVKKPDKPKKKVQKKVVSEKEIEIIDKKMLLKDLALIALVIVLALSGYLLSKYIG